MTPSGSVAQPSAAARAANAASSVTTITSATRVAARAAATVSRANAVASAVRCSSGSPASRDLPRAGGLTGTRTAKRTAASGEVDIAAILPSGHPRVAATREATCR